MVVNWAVISFISRFIIFILASLQMVFFYKKYKESKEGISPNTYFLGNTFFFLAMALVMFLIGLQEMFSYFEIFNISFDSTNFPEYDTNTHQLYYLENLGSNPVYLGLTIFALVVFTIQIYPLEKILGKKNILSKILLLDCILCGIVFIPGIRLSLIEFIILNLAYLSLFLGFLMNFYLTGSLIKNSTGIVRKRAILNITGFFLFMVGIVWGMRVGWTEAILGIFGGSVPLDADVLVGSSIMLLAMYIYYQAFKLGE
jgi:hypothetical protein